MKCSIKNDSFNILLYQMIAISISISISFPLLHSNNNNNKIVESAIGLQLVARAATL